MRPNSFRRRAAIAASVVARYPRLASARHSVAQSLERRTLLSDVPLDPNFGFGGITGPDEGGALDVALNLPGDKILVAGNNFFERYNANGSRDASFGRHGIVSFNVPFFQLKGAALTPQGKIVAVGQLFGDSPVAGSAIARFNFNGTLDATFGSGGIVDVNEYIDNGFTSSSLAIQPDGKIVVCESNNDATGMLVARYLTNGAPDPAFGNNGQAVFDFPGAPQSQSFSFATSLALRPDGRIIVGGTAATTQFGIFALAQLTSTGQLDSTFGGGTGEVQLPGPFNNGGIYQLGLLSDGRIITNNGELLAFNADGTPDTSFGTNGAVSGVGGPFEIQANDKIVVFNGGFPPTIDSLTRFTSQGQLDPTFGQGGSVLVNHENLPPLSYLFLRSLIGQPDGIVLGYDFSGGTDVPALFRYTLDGAPVLSFGRLGEVIPDFTGLFGEFRDDAVLANGSILAVGQASDASAQPSLFVEKFRADGSIDSSFGVGGRIVSHVGGFDFASRITLEPDGSFLVLATTGEPQGNTVRPTAIMRFTASGKPFTSFGANGVIDVPDNVTGFALQPDGKIITVGSASVETSDFQATTAEIRRYKTNGQLDATFGNGGRIANFGLGMSDVAMQGNNIIVATGFGDYRGFFGAYGNEIAVERLKPGGTLDKSFGENGMVVIGSDDDSIGSMRMAIGSDGNIAITHVDEDSDVQVATVTSDGSLAYLSKTPNPGYGSYDTSIALQHDEELVVAAQSAGPQLGGIVQRLNPDTSLDGSLYQQFKTDSRLVNFFVRGIAVAANGSLLVCGFGGDAQPGRPALLRELPTPTVPQLTSTDLSYFGPVALTVTGTDGNDTIRITQSGTIVTAVVNNGTPFQTNFQGGFYNQINVFGLDGNDTIIIGATTIPVRVDGGNGNDSITAGSAPSTLVGGEGNDFLAGGTGAATLLGGDGNDLLRPGTGPTNDILGGAGLDTVDYSQRTKGVEVHLDGLRDSGYANERDLIGIDVERVYGSQGNDTIFGNFNGVKNALYGLGGSDTIYAGNGSDALYGGDGNDWLYSRNNVADYLDGGPGIDTGHIDKLDLTVSVEKYLK